MRQILPVFLFLVVGRLSAQPVQMLHFSHTVTINDFELDGPIIWAATPGALVRYDRNTGVVSHINRTNSTIPTNSIHSVAIDSDGTKWLGTPIGLVKVTADTFELLNPPGLILRAKKVEADALGNIWVMNDSGLHRLYRFDGSNWHTYDANDLFNGISDIQAVPTAPGLWILSPDDSYYYYDGNNVSHYPLPDLGDAPGTAVIYTWHLDRMGQVRGNSGKKICFLNGSSWEVEEADFLPNTLASSMDGTLWSSSYDGIHRRNSDGSWELVSEARLTSHESMMKVADNYELWAGSSSGLSSFIQGEGVRKISTEFYPVPASAVQEIISVDGGVWATFGSSFHAVDPINYSGRPYIFQDAGWAPAPGTISSCNNIYRDAAGWLWMVSHGGITYFDGQWHFVPNPPEFPFEYVASLTVVPNTQQVWASGIGKLAKLTDGDFQVYDLLPPNDVLNIICADQQGRVWGAKTTGPNLSRFDGQNWVHFSAQDMELSEFTQLVRLVVAPNGYVWVVTDYEISYFDGLQWNKFPVNAYNYGIFSAIAFDGDETIWIACHHYYSADEDIRLIKYTNGDVQLYSYQTIPLPHPNIKALAVDAHHNVWIGCEAGGIAVFNENGVTLNAGEVFDGSRQQRMAASISPNPAGVQATLEYELPATSDVLIELRDAAGRILLHQSGGMQQAGRQRWNLPLQNLPAGPLFWRVMSRDAVASGRVLKQG